jgi:hypothetical protein
MSLRWISKFGRKFHPKVSWRQFLAPEMFNKESARTALGHFGNHMTKLDLLGLN